jgi:hypothetical protein
MKNRHGYSVEVSPIEKIDWYEDGGCAITRGEPGWGTFGLGAEELNGFKPEVGDAIIVYTQGFSQIAGVAIDGHVLRYNTPEVLAAKHQEFVNANRLKRLEEYVAHGDELKARAEALPAPLRERMRRFADQGGTEFWIEDASYEMYALEGAAALLRKVQSLGLVNDIDNTENNSDQANDTAVQWLEDWWALNTKEHNYDYKTQMQMVPEFGDGHSGNTAGAAYSMAKAVLSGQEV